MSDDERRFSAFVALMLMDDIPRSETEIQNLVFILQSNAFLFPPLYNDFLFGESGMFSNKLSSDFRLAMKKKYVLPVDVSGSSKFKFFGELSNIDTIQKGMRDVNRRKSADFDEVLSRVKTQNEHVLRLSSAKIYAGKSVGDKRKQNEFLKQHWDDIDSRALAESTRLCNFLCTKQ